MRKIGWAIKLPLLLVLFAVLPLLVMSVWSLALFSETNTRTTLQRLEALVTAKASAVEQFTRDRESEVERIAKLIAPQVALVVDREPPQRGAAPPEALPALQDAENLPPAETDAATQGTAEASGDLTVQAPIRALRGATDEAMPSLRRELGLILWDQEKFEELLVIAQGGEVLASTFGAHEGRTAAELAYFGHGLGATYVQPVFLSPITERLTMVIATPIRDADAQVIGVLAARLNLERFFRLINDSRGLGVTGETIAARRFDSVIRFMAPTRHDPQAALARQVELGAPQGVALQRAAAGEAGAERVMDYRGVCTLSAWQHVPSLDWALASKIDCEEAAAPVVAARARLAAYTLAIALLALGLAVIAARRLVAPLRTLKDAADRISKGDVDVEIGVSSGDEIGELADSFERMIAAIKYFRERGASAPDDEEPDEDPEEEEGLPEHA